VNNLTTKVLLLSLKENKDSGKVWNDYLTIKRTANFKGYNPSDNYILRCLYKGYKRQDEELKK
jgi:hypothetical protein